jgi:hypothetical protein
MYGAASQVQVLCPGVVAPVERTDIERDRELEKRGPAHPNAGGQAPRAARKLMSGKNFNPAPQLENMHGPGSPAPNR